MLWFISAPARKKTRVHVIKINENENKKNNNRFEWLQLSYDTFYEPSSPFHIEIGFLITAGKQIEAWIKNCFRIAKKLKINLVKIPTRQTFRTSCFLQLPIVINLSNHTLRKKAIQYLIEQCQFVLSFPTKSFRKEYMHELGIALVRIRSSGLVWIKNHLITQSSEEEYNLHLQIFEKFQKYIHIQQLKYEQ